MNTTTVKNPLVQLADQLCQQAAAVHAVLLKQIEEMIPGDSDDPSEFDALRKIFAENRKKIEDLLVDQVTTVEELLEFSGRVQAA